MAKGAIVTEKVFASIMILHEANPELNNTQIGMAFKMDASTVGKMIRCGTWEEYKAFKKEKAEKGRLREQARKAEPKQAEEQAEGQIEMQLDPEESTEKKPEMSDQVKMMRFQAGQADRIIEKMMFNADAILMKLDKLNDTMSMILRAVRRE